VTSRTGGEVGWYVREERGKYTSHTYAIGGTAATAMMWDSGCGDVGMRH